MHWISSQLSTGTTTYKHNLLGIKKSFRHKFCLFSSSAISSIQILEFKPKAIIESIHFSPMPLFLTPELIGRP